MVNCSPEESNGEVGGTGYEETNKTEHTRQLKEMLIWAVAIGRTFFSEECLKAMEGDMAYLFVTNGRIPVNAIFEVGP